LSRGLLSGSKPADAGDFRARLPRFAPENRERNQKLVDALSSMASERHVPTAALAIAWAMAKAEFIVPVIGARTRAQLHDALAALSVQLTSDDIAMLEQLVPASEVAGTRYDMHQMRMLDSEK
jgi:aryl-alcohol dehydrogenase-like predicted oxidoreductase